MIQKRHPYSGSLKAEKSGDSKLRFYIVEVFQETDSLRTKQGIYFLPEVPVCANPYLLTLYTAGSQPLPLSSVYCLALSTCMLSRQGPFLDPASILQLPTGPLQLCQPLALEM